MKKKKIAVIGAGHAGVEAAVAAARLGVPVQLFTFSLDSIGKLSCNPAVGGVAKSHLVREVDILGGAIGRLADATSLQYRLLNRSKGQAVQATRVQVDRFRYPRVAKEFVLSFPLIEPIEAEVYEILTRGNKVVGVKTNLGDFSAAAVIVAAGTFLDSTIHIGFTHFKQGRLGEPAAKRLFESIKRLGLKTRYFKTGTCARLDKRTVDFSRLLEQKPDRDVLPFSFFTRFKPKNNHSCYIAYTNKRTHRIIKKGLKFSPLYQGIIKATGVRYCPSLEDKVVKFPHKERHQVFIEPEGEGSFEVYPNGISTSLPFDVQYKFIHSIEGLERAVILRPGYGIEHGLIDARQLKSSLEAKDIKGLFFAGQVNGTTGYEEAAAQGIMAGINAALFVQKKEPFVMRRDEGFIGLLVDELVNKGTDEPYRMFTSRSELKLALREDNALLRLFRVSYNLGLIDKAAFLEIGEIEKRIKGALAELRREKLLYKLKGKKAILVNAYELLRRPQVNLEKIERLRKKNFSLSSYERKEVEIEVKYEGFIKREKSYLKEMQRFHKIKIPPHIDYRKLAGLSGEIKEKLSKNQPKTLAAALQISGVTPAAGLIILNFIRNYAEKNSKKKKR